MSWELRMKMFHPHLKERTIFCGNKSTLEEREERYRLILKGGRDKLFCFDNGHEKIAFFLSFPLHWGCWAEVWTVNKCQESKHYSFERERGQGSIF